MAGEVIYQSSEELQSAAEEWQKILRLSDWKVNAAIVRGGGMNLEPENIGRCRPVLCNKSATLAVIDPQDYDPQSCFPLDHEQVLVHELLHLHFESFWKKKHKVDMEQAIECISSALVKAKRSRHERE